MADLFHDWNAAGDKGSLFDAVVLDETLRDGIQSPSAIDPAIEAKIEILPYLTSDLPSVLLDRESFRGALLNLILNAQQAMPDGGTLVVATELTPRGVALHMIDNGCGMSEKTLSRMFEAFYSTKPNGSGLGLPTTKKIVEAHGGRIDVQSKEGKGTQFTIELPVSESRAAA